MTEPVGGGSITIRVAAFDHCVERRSDQRREFWRRFLDFEYAPRILGDGRETLEIIDRHHHEAHPAVLRDRHRLSRRSVSDGFQVTQQFDGREVTHQLNIYAYVE